MADHARRMPPDQAPHLSTFAAMTIDERWVARTPQEMLDTFHWWRPRDKRHSAAHSR
jgi:hypothetical protein